MEPRGPAEPLEQDQSAIHLEDATVLDALGSDCLVAAFPAQRRDLQLGQVRRSHRVALQDAPNLARCDRQRMQLAPRTQTPERRRWQQ